MSKDRANKATKAQRIDFVHKLIADGLLKYQIVDKCMDEWKISARAVEKYLTHVYNFLHEQTKNNNTVETILAEYQKLIAKYEAKDPKLAHQYRLQRDKILGISTQKVDVTSNGKDIGISEVIIKIVTDKDETKDRS